MTRAPPPTYPIDELPAELDRTLLHVFVVGPGRGEGVAVALPDRGWLVLDGATTEFGASALQAILARWKRSDESVEWALLSHPHDDHVDGFADVLNAYTPGQVGVAGADGAPRYIDIFKGATLPEPTDRRQKAAKIRTAFTAIRSWESATGKPATGLHRGSVLIERTDVSARVLGPPMPALIQYLEECAASPAYLRTDANRYSLVVEITFGGTHIVLPGDVPRTVGKKLVTPGSDELAGYAPRLANHAILKIPHHGSAEAINPSFMTAGAPDRAWPITPYSSSRLPSGDGLAEIVSCGRPVFLTALPVSKRAQAVAVDGVVDLSQIEPRLAGQQAGNPFTDSRTIEVTPGSARDVLDCVWCFATDNAGSIVATHRGRAALSIRVP